MSAAEAQEAGAPHTHVHEIVIRVRDAYAPCSARNLKERPTVQIASKPGQSNEVSDCSELDEGGLKIEPALA